MAPAVRRSGRERQANKKYQNDLLEKETLRLLRESSESSRPTSPDTSDSEEVKSDVEFDTAKIDKVENKDEEDDLSSISGNGKGVSEGSEIGTPNESDENMSIATSGVSAPEDYEGRPRRPGPRAAQRVNTEAHSRGLQTTHRNAGRENIWRSLVGPTDEDIIPLLLARDQWKLKRDATFPSRKSLSEIARQGVYGNVSRFGISADDLRHEATRGWDWYEEETGNRFRKRQRLESIQDTQGLEHIALTTKQDSRIVMGPTQSQQAYHLAHLTAMDFGQAWEKEPVSPKKPITNARMDNVNVEPSSNVHSDSTSHPAHSRYREGWLLNLGSKIQCFGWAPNRHGSDAQYLALSTSCSLAQRNSVPASIDRRSPAFRPSPPYPSSIQIWAFSCTPLSEGLQKPDMNTRPRLVQVLCTHWGNIRQLQWCPVLREPRDKPEQEIDGLGSTNLGLIGVIASDGHARVLDVSVPMSTESGPQYLSVKSAAFDASSSSSIYSCLSFASPTDLLCGTASGSVDIFSILQDHDVSKQTSTLTTPYLTTQQSSTYILTLTPAYPSTFPNLLASASMNGAPTLTDLRAPSIDKVIGKSARIAKKHLAYSPHLRSYLFAAEDDAIQACPIRRFFNGIRIARFAGQGSLTALATSRWHPCLLIGTSSGTVSCTNILRRVLPSMKRGSDAGAWVQKLCEYHWVPGSPVLEEEEEEEEEEETSTANVYSAAEGTGNDAITAAAAASTHPIPTTTTNSSIHKNQNPTPPTKFKVFYPPSPSPAHSAGTSRFYESFKATKQDLSTSTRPSKSKSSTTTTTNSTNSTNTSTNTSAAGAKTKLGTETVYHEEQAVTAMEWNGNLECGGWLAVGWGGGVVRVEDCGV